MLRNILVAIQIGILSQWVLRVNLVGAKSILGNETVQADAENFTNFENESAEFKENPDAVPQVENITETGLNNIGASFNPNRNRSDEMSFRYLSSESALDFHPVIAEELHSDEKANNGAGKWGAVIVISLFVSTCLIKGVPVIVVRAMCGPCPKHPITTEVKSDEASSSSNEDSTILEELNEIEDIWQQKLPEIIVEEVDAFPEKCTKL